MSPKAPCPQTPVLPLRDVVVFPHMVVPLFVGREKSIQALTLAQSLRQQIILVTQQAPDAEDPTELNLYHYGTLGVILQTLKLPDGTLKVLIEGQQRVQILQYIEQEDALWASYQPTQERILPDFDQSAACQKLIFQFTEYVKQDERIADEVVSNLNGLDSLARLIDSIGMHMMLGLDDKQLLLECHNIEQRLELLSSFIVQELEFLATEARIKQRVKQQMNKNQREYYLSEKIKAIHKEMDGLDDGQRSELALLEKKIIELKLPEQAAERANAELKRLKSLAPLSAEAAVSRNYLEVLSQFPWHQASEMRYNIDVAEKQLNDDHYGLEKVKERILEYLAVHSRAKHLKAPILCLIGPPGVGKTSLGRSIAEATGRKFIRMALGGMRDEAEIRGHRRTYIGAMPGKIVQSLSRIGSNNPLFLLDEIDKMSSDFRGDPASALLEVLDPEQNHAFNDHYLDVNVDLSSVMFIATANSFNIPAALRDRLEIIRIAGYTEEEKQHIARRYLLPKQVKANGLKTTELTISDDAILDVVRYYTREAGVRQLERELGSIARKTIKRLISDKKTKKIKVDADALAPLLGVRKYRYGMAEHDDAIGQVTGLAWTEVGGDLLTIEVALLRGKGELIHTGSLGDVMKESIRAAVTVVRARAEKLGIAPDFHEKYDLHIHAPEGATPKDGPSAGIAIVTALVSALTHIPVKASIAMTGEITLRGRVLAIGGLKEKLLAAARGGIKTVLIPAENEKDLAEIPLSIQDRLTIYPVKDIEAVLAFVLGQLTNDNKKTTGSKTKKNKHDLQQMLQNNANEMNAC